MEFDTEDQVLFRYKFAICNLGEASVYKLWDVLQERILKNFWLWKSIFSIYLGLCWGYLLLYLAKGCPPIWKYTDSYHHTHLQLMMILLLKPFFKAWSKSGQCQWIKYYWCCCSCCCYCCSYVCFWSQKPTSNVGQNRATKSLYIADIEFSGGGWVVVVMCKVIFV